MDNIAEYERQVAKHFAIYGTVYDFVRKKIDGKFNPVTQIANMLAIFRFIHMKRKCQRTSMLEDRFGMDIKLHLAKVAIPGLVVLQACLQVVSVITVILPTVLTIGGQIHRVFLKICPYGIQYRSIMV